MKKLQQAVVNIREVFVTYAGEDGDSTTLTKRELAALLREELEIKLSRKGAAKCFKDLDDDGDGVVNFNEYLTFLITCIKEFNDLYEN